MTTSVWAATTPRKLIARLIAVVILAAPTLLVTTAHAVEPIQVPRYDDADDYLPNAIRKNKDGVRLLLKQQEGESLFKVLTPRNVLVDVIENIPKDADAGVVILLGGNGVLSIVDDKLDRSFSFQPRSRDYWWANKFATFLVDAPSDRLGKEGIQDANWRSGADHKTDLQAVMETIGKHFSGPLVIFGHSNGAISLANTANMNFPSVKAYVFSSPAHYKLGTSILQDVTYGAPVLLFENTKDSCSSAASRWTESFFKSLKAESKKLIWIEGGAEPNGGACGPFGYHSFYGYEKQTIDAMVTEIRQVVK